MMVVGGDGVVETFVGVAVVVELAEPAGARVVAHAMAGHGAVALVAPLRFRYTPQAGFVGIDGFGYRLEDQAGERTGWVSVRVRQPNRPPSAWDDLVMVPADTIGALPAGPVRFWVLDNDHDPDGDALRITGFDLPAHGQLVLNDDESFTYTPGPSYPGRDGFAYRIEDVRSPGNGPALPAEATVTLFTPPIPPPPNIEPIATNDRATTTRGTPVVIDILANDFDLDASETDAGDPDAGEQEMGGGGPLRITALTLPMHGLVVLDADQRAIYTPEPDFVGVDDFTYVIEDARGGVATGIVVIEVSP